MKKTLPIFLILLLLALTANAGSTGYQAFSLREVVSQTSPATGYVLLYAKNDGLLYSQDSAGTETQVSGGGGSAGFTIGLPASAAVASVSSTTYPAFTTNSTSGVPHLAFDGATQEATEWHSITLPASYDSAANATFEIVISSGSISQAIRWGVRFATVEAAAMSTAPGTLLATAQYATTTTSATANTATTVSWTLNNTALDSAAAGDLIFVQLARDAASAEDSSTVDVFVNTARLTQ